jgi:uncharacterized RDD family membrane protein YckC
VARSPTLRGGTVPSPPQTKAASSPWPPPVAPYELGGPPAHWWPGRTAGLPADGPGSLAPISERVRARVIDLAIILAVVLALIGIAAAVRAIANIPEREGDWLQDVVGAVVLLLLVGYDPVTTRLLGGTPGKRLLHVRVVRSVTLQPAPPGALALRALIHVTLWLLIVPGILNAVAAANDPLRQGWHDRVAKTLVVRR